MLENCLLLIILFMFAVKQHFSAINASDQYNNLYSSICFMLPIIPNNKILTRQNFVLYIIFILILLQTIMVMPQQQQQQTNNFIYNLVSVINVILAIFILLQYIALIKIDKKNFKLYVSAHYKNNTHICI